MSYLRTRACFGNACEQKQSQVRSPQYGAFFPVKGRCARHEIAHGFDSRGGA